MASTYSSTLRIELIGDGDQSGIWGQTTNNNLGSIIEQAITGVQSITMTDANYTLTSYNGVVDEARNVVLSFTGSLSATRDIIIPGVEKTYIIKNVTTGGQSIRVKTSGGSVTVTVPNGATAAVYCDATNVYTQINYTPENFSVGANLYVSGSASTAGNNISNGNTTSNTYTASGTGHTLGYGGYLWSPGSGGYDSWRYGNYQGSLFWHNTTDTADYMVLGPTGNLTLNGGSFTGLAAISGGTIASATISGCTINGATVNNTTLAATVSWACLPAGTVMTFAQAAAPTGWTQINLDSTSNRMLRVVNGGGGGYGGGNSPILMDVVPSHTHTYSSTSGTQSADHYHGYSGNTAGVSNDHTHSGTTAGNGTHNHWLNATGNGGSNYGGVRNDVDGSYYAQPGGPFVQDSGYHDHSFTTGGASANHTHAYSGNTGGVSANHTHAISGTTAANGSASNWQPRYLDLIACSKN